MNQWESGSYEWNEEQVVEAIVGYLGNVEGIRGVKRVSQGFAAMFQALIRISFVDGEVIRLGVGYVEDEEDQEAFDDRFPP